MIYKFSCSTDIPRGLLLKVIPILHCISLLRIILLVISARTSENGGFFFMAGLHRDYNHGASIKQLLDEVEHDTMNYQNRGLCYLPQPSASADTTDTRC